MKRIILMLAICGTVVTLPAQVSNPVPDRSKDKTIAPDRKIEKRTDKNTEMPSGLSTATYTHTPVDQDKTEVSIPEKVRNAFKKDHPNDEAKWSRDDKNKRYTAKYKETYKDGDVKNKVESVVTYDDGGKIIRTESEVKYKDLPVAIVTYYEKNFPGGVVKVWQVHNKQDGTTKYYAMQNGKTVWFDREGKQMMDHDDWHHDMPEPYYK